MRPQYPFYVIIPHPGTAVVVGCDNEFEAHKVHKALAEYNPSDYVFTTTALPKSLKTPIFAYPSEVADA